MSIIDRSWSEPHGIAVVAPVEAVEAAPVELVAPALAAGTAAHAAIVSPAGGDPAPVAEPARDAPRLFFNMPVGPPHAGQAWPMSRPDLAGGRPQHDATSIVAPLPRPRAQDLSEPPRAVKIASEHAARVRHQRAAARRGWRIVLLACPLAGIALGFAVLALLSREPAPRVAAPAPPAARVVMEVTAPAAPAKAVRPKAAAPKKPAARAIAAAEPRTAAVPKAAAPKAAPKAAVQTATRRSAPDKPKTAAPARKPAKKVAVKDSPAAKKPAARTAKATKTAKAAPPATSKLAKSTAKSKQPAPAKPARR